MKHSPSRAGFTIVELLVVIIVIGILATVVSLGYSGLIKQSKTNDAQTDASVLAKKLENYYSGTGSYPLDQTAAGYTTLLNSRADSSIANANITLAPNGAVTAANGQRTLAVSYCTAPAAAVTATAYRIEYFDFGKNLLTTTPVTNTAGPTPCNTWQYLR